MFFYCMMQNVYCKDFILNLFLHIFEIMYTIYFWWNKQLLLVIYLFSPYWFLFCILPLIFIHPSPHFITKYPIGTYTKNTNYMFIIISNSLSWMLLSKFLIWNNELIILLWFSHIFYILNMHSIHLIWCFIRSNL